MAAFFQKLVRRFVSGSSAAGPGVYVGAFGKHPGASDHFDFIPPDAACLTATWELLYDQGIKSLVGVWRQFADAERLADFKHLFLWRTADSIVVGRMWSSHDGASPPRRDFPMVVCAECQHLPLAWILQHVVPALERFEARAKATTSMTIVRDSLETIQAELRATLTSPETPPSDDHADLLHALAGLVTHPALCPPNEGIQRILHHLDRDSESRSHNFSTSASFPVITSTVQLRVPAMAVPSESVALWAEFFLAYLHELSSLFLLVPDGEPWVDVILAPPAASRFSCIRSTIEKIPLTTSIPYHFDPNALVFYQHLVRQACETAGLPAPASDDVSAADPALSPACLKPLPVVEETPTPPPSAPSSVAAHAPVAPPSESPPEESFYRPPETPASLPSEPEFSLSPRQSVFSEPLAEPEAEPFVAKTPFWANTRLIILLIVLVVIALVGFLAYRLSRVHSTIVAPVSCADAPCTATLVQHLQGDPTGVGG